MTQQPSRWRTLGGSALLIAVALTVAAPKLLWWLQPPRATCVVVVDKTVPHPDYREHRGLYWVLRQTKATTPSGEATWHLRDHYVGWYPEQLDDRGEPLRTELLDAHLDGASLLVLADTYGVYSDDLANAERHAANDWSKRLFGGLSVDEVARMEAYVAGGGHLYAEFNTLASPTHGEARQRLERLLGVDWTGWSGRWFRHLDDLEDVPGWAPRLHTAQTGQPWSYTGAGWVLVHEDGRIVVLVSATHMGAKSLQVVPRAPRSELLAGADASTGSRYWFDIVTPRSGSEVLATYELDVTESGATLLAEAGLPSAFPALVQRSDAPLVLYGAGDFSDIGFETGGHYAGKPWVRGMLPSGVASQASFYWNFYVPLLTEVIERSPCR